MALTNGLRLVVQTRVQDKICSFGIAYKTDFTLTNDTTSDLALGWFAANEALLLGILATDVTFEGLYCYSLLPDVVLPHRVPGVSQPGTRPGTSNPANSCLVVTLQTVDPGAVRQGRVYVSGISKTDLTQGVWAAAFLATQVTTFADSLADPIAITGGIATPQIAQRVIAGVPIAGNLLPVTSSRVTNIPYTQRRRTTKQLGFGPIP